MPVENVPVPSIPASPPEPIAIIGIGCRFPGDVRGAEAYWQLLVSGTDAICDVPADRWNHALYYHPEPGKPGRTTARQGGFLRGVDLFDADCFGISPREAAHLDPQQRLALEVTWDALEDAGLALDRVAGSATAVFMGISNNEYTLLQTVDSIGTHSSTGQAACMASNRVSYAFDFRGPSVSVDTACSSSLVAVHLACRSLWNGDATMAVAGGVNGLVYPTTFVSFSALGMLSPDSRCKAFDEGANGFVRAEGGGAVILKPISRAQADGDRILGLILATGTNQDGHSQGGLTFPSAAAQESLLRQVYAQAGITPGEVSYVEAHGTGTQAGDPVEAAALGRVLGVGRNAAQPLVIGSAKTNLGHLESAAGIAGLIKACLVLRHRQIPPNLHFKKPNPRIPFGELNLRVPVALEPLAGTTALIAGVNGFGFGGSNAHAVLREYIAPQSTPAPTSSTTPAAVALPLSARSAEALRALARSCESLLADDPAALTDLAYTAALHRTHHPHRLVVTGATTESIRERLRAYVAGETPGGLAVGRAPANHVPRLAYVFTGQGPQWWGMGRELLAREPVFRAAVERCDAVIRPLGGWSLLAELSAGVSTSRMAVTAIAQPAIFAIQAGLADLWKSWGVRPAAVVGHSVGEIAAGYAAGVFSLEEGARIAFHRGSCMDRASSKGAMIAVGLSEAAVHPYLVGHRRHVDIAAINSPVSLTLSGDPTALAAISGALGHDQVFWRPLRVEYAFHSVQMDPVEPDIRAALADLAPRPASAALLVSTVTGAISRGDDWDAGYWWQNLRQSVRFADAIDVLTRDGIDVFLEIGPHPALAGPLAECVRHRQVTATILGSLRREQPETETLLNTLGSLHLHGQPITWSALHLHGRRRAFPLYPWQHERHWSADEDRNRLIQRASEHPLLGVAQSSPRPSWRHRLDLRLHPYLADHQLQGVPLFPAAGYLDMALAAALLAKGPTHTAIEDIEIDAPCFLPAAEPLPMELRFGADENRFEIFSRPKRDGAWSRHASGRIAALTTPTPHPVESLASLKLRLPTILPATATYAAFAAQGLSYGPSFRGLQQTWSGDCEALGEIILPDAVPLDAGYCLHPALLDVCLQVAIETVPAHLRVKNTYLPVGVGRLRYFRAPGRRVHCHVRLVEFSRTGLTANLRLLDDAGSLLADLQSFRCKAIAPETATSSVAEDLLLVSEWQLAPLAPAAEPLAPSHWVILENAAGIGARLREALTPLGHTITLVHVANTFAQRPDGDYSIDPSDLAAPIAALAAEPPALLINLWPLDLGPSPVDAERGLIGSLQLIQALATWPTPTPPRVWFVTSRAQPVEATDRSVLALGQSPLWGFRRVAAFEHAAFRPTIVDVGDLSSTENLTSLVTELLADSPEDEIAIRGTARFVHRLRRITAEQSNPPIVRTTPAATTPFRVVTSRTGALDHLHLAVRPSAPLSPGEIRVAVKASALNFSDVLKALGLYPGITAETFSLGIECAGVIAEIGPPHPSVAGADLQIGDRVLALASHSLGAFVNAPAPYVLPIPPKFSFAEAAAIPIVFMTAHYALLDVGRLRAGERVLIHAATGGVGLAAIQIARKVGAEIFATAGTPEKRDYLRSLGVAHVMDSRTLAFADEILDATEGEGVDLVLNSLAGEAIAKGLASLRPFGRFIEIGKRDLYANTPVGLRPFRNNISFSAVDLDQAIRTRPQLVAALFREVMAGFADGSYRALPVRVFPITELVESFRHLSKAQHIGKVIVSNEVSEVSATFPPATAPIRPDATYLIAGGVGGFSLTLGQWLARRGAKHLVFASRRGANAPETAVAVAEFATQGCSVEVHATDLTNLTQVNALVAHIAAKLPPLRGIIHSAMVIDDGAITRLDAARVRGVTRVKIDGAWNLHSATLGTPLDFFLLASSIASLYGSPGQCHYAAANAFLDALAHFRNGLGLPALTVNLGALAAVGHLSRRPELEAYMKKMGITPLAPAEVLTGLELLLGGASAQVGLARVDFDRVRRMTTQAAFPPRFKELAAGSTTAARDAKRPLLSALTAAATPVEARIIIVAAVQTEVSRVLGVPVAKCAIDRPLTELGLDSLMMVELVSWTESALNVKLPTVEFMRNPTIDELSALLLKHVTAAADGSAVAASAPVVVDLAAEAKLDPSIVPDANRPPTDLAENILLTGATGFVGAFILRELLLHTRATIHCLVRADDEAAGLARIRETLENYDAAVPDWPARVRPVTGSLAAPYFALAPAAFDALAETLDAIYHVAAVVDFIRPYAALRDANVGGTQEILRLTAAGRPKRLHYVSSIAVFSLTHYRGAIPEHTIPNETDGLPDGYSQSKWVAEQLVHEALRRGLRARIYRLGVISAHSETGAANHSDASLQLLGACCLCGKSPNFAWRANNTPVDIAAAAIRCLSLRQEGDGEIYHICAPEPTPIETVATWMRAHGQPFEGVPFARWRSELATRLAGSRFEGIMALIPEDEATAQERFCAGARPFGTENTRAALAGHAVSLVTLSETHFANYLGRLRKDFPLIATRPASAAAPHLPPLIKHIP